MIWPAGLRSATQPLWNPEFKSRTFSPGRLRFDSSSVRFYKCPRYVKTYSGPSMLPSARKVDLMKAVEQPRQILRKDANAFVGHGHSNSVWLIAQLNAYGCRLIGILACVVQEMEQDLLSFCSIESKDRCFRGIQHELSTRLPSAELIEQLLGDPDKIHVIQLQHRP